MKFVENKLQTCSTKMQLHQVRCNGYLHKSLSGKEVCDSLPHDVVSTEMLTICEESIQGSYTRLTACDSAPVLWPSNRCVYVFVSQCFQPLCSLAQLARVYLPLQSFALGVSRRKK